MWSKYKKSTTDILCVLPIFYKLQPAMVIANIYTLKAPSLGWKGMIVFSSTTVLFFHPSYGYKWLRQSSSDRLGFVCDKCKGKAGEAFEMESWAIEGWELDHIKPLRVKVDTFCPWQFNICLVFRYICWVTFLSMNSTDEECSWTGRDFPGKGPRFRQILIFITESLQWYLTWKQKNVSFFLSLF